MHLDLQIQLAKNQAMEGMNQVQLLGRKLLHKHHDDDDDDDKPKKKGKKCKKHNKEEEDDHDKHHGLHAEVCSYVPFMWRRSQSLGNWAKPQHNLCTRISSILETLWCRKNCKLSFSFQAYWMHCIPSIILQSESPTTYQHLLAYVHGLISIHHTNRKFALLLSWTFSRWPWSNSWPTEVKLVM